MLNEFKRRARTSRRPYNTMRITFRQETREDLPEIVRMLADDFLGSTREIGAPLS